MRSADERRKLVESTRKVHYSVPKMGAFVVEMLDQMHERLLFCSQLGKVSIVDEYHIGSNLCFSQWFVTLH